MASLKLHANNFATTLDGAITNVATSITLTSATGLPTLSGSEFYHLTIDDGTNIEIVKVTADGSSPTLTVVRAQEGTTGFAFADLDPVQMRMTADDVDRKLDDVEGDTSPILGGNLDANTFDITDVGDFVAGGATQATNTMALFNSASSNFICSTSSMTNATVKNGRFGCPHYTNSEEPGIFAALVCNTSDNIIRLGGGTAQGNAATLTQIYAAANNTTATGSEVARFTSSGLSFDSGSNYFDAYEKQQTFTPTISFGTPGDLSVVYTNQTGIYTLLSDVCQFVITLSFTPTFTTASGAFKINAMPFTAANAGGGLALRVGNSITYPTGRTAITCKIQTATSYLNLLANGSAVAPANVNASEFVSGTAVVVELVGTYNI